MPYDPKLVQPMREELTRLGVQELRTAEDVDEVLGRRQGATMVVVNSREYFVGFSPSSPSITLQQDGELVFMLERHQIEGREAAEIAREIRVAFDRFCPGTSAPVERTAKNMVSR